MRRITGLVAIVTSALALVGCGGGDDTAAPSASGATTTAPTSTPNGASSAPSSATPLRMGSLPAGMYKTNLFEPQLVFTLSSGWRQFFPDEDDEIYVGTANAELAISRPVEVRDPTTGEAVPAPEDLLGWLVDHPDLNSSEPTAVAIGGIGSHYVEPSTTRDVGVFAFRGGDYRIVAGAKQRVYVIPLSGPDLAVTIAASESGTLADAIPVAEPTVESLEIIE